METDTRLRSDVDAVQDEELDGSEAAAINCEFEDGGAVQEGWVAVVDVGSGFNEAGYEVGEATTGSPEEDGVFMLVEISSDQGGD